MDEAAHGNVEIRRQLEAIRAAQADTSSRISNLFSSTRTWQADLVNTMYREDWRPFQENKKRNFGDIAKVSRKMTDVVRQEREAEARRRLIDSLKFFEIRDRQQRISQAHAKTFRWVYRHKQRGGRPSGRLADWLERDSGIFWITGKPASGKSTLMKYVEENSKTHRHLQNWAGSGFTLMKCRYFFWRAGDHLQKSTTGLLQTLLYDCLSQVPDLVPKVLPQRWASFHSFGDDGRPWSWFELAKAFDLTVKFLVSQQTIKLFLIVDGLDECEGDHFELISLLQQVALLSDDVKILLASRPEQAFQDSFQHGPNIRMQDLTFPDITAYIDAELCTQPIFQRFKNNQQQHADLLVEQIAQKASGVFLWVILAVRSLVTGLRNGDRVSDLEQRLAAIPPELDELYSSLLRSLEPLYFKHASEIFQIVRACPTQLNLLDLAFTDEQNLTFQGEDGVFALVKDEVESRNDIGVRQLTSRCRGLLEVSNISSNNQQPDVLAAEKSSASDSSSGDEDQSALDTASDDSTSDSEDDTGPLGNISAQTTLAIRGRLKPSPLPMNPEHPKQNALPIAWGTRPLGNQTSVNHGRQLDGHVSDTEFGPVDSCPEREIIEETDTESQFAPEHPRPERQTREEVDPETPIKDVPAHYPSCQEGQHHVVTTYQPMDRIVEPVHRRIACLEHKMWKPEKSYGFHTPWYYSWTRRKQRGIISTLDSSDEVEKSGHSDPHIRGLAQTPRTAALGDFPIFSVDYIHKTAKDFMEQPQNWRVILSGSDPGFSPQLALLRSSICMLGRLPPSKISTFTFWAWVIWCFQCAAEAEKAGIHAVDSYWLNQLDRAAARTAISTSGMGRNLLKIAQEETPFTWSPTIVKDFRTGISRESAYGFEEHDPQSRWRLGPKLAVLCIQWNLPAVLEQMVESGMPLTHDRSGRPMLEYIWIGRGDGPNKNEEASFEDRSYEKYYRRFPSGASIASLIKGGADPNEWYANGTPWLRTLARMYKVSISKTRQEAQKANDFQAWYDVYTAFIQGDADPLADLNCPSGSYARELFEKWDRGKLKRLQSLMKTKQRKLPPSR